MSKLTVIVVLVGVAAAGLLRLGARLLASKKKRRFAETYLARFRSLAASDAFDDEAYAWLVTRSARLQEALGPLGLNSYGGTLAYDLPPPPPDPLFINTLPELRSGRARPERVAQCEEALIRYLGLLDEERAGHIRHFFNPIIWLGEGVRAALLLPFLTLHWLGVFKDTFIERLDRSAAFGLLAGLVAVVGLAASMMIVMLGWDRFTAMTEVWIGAVFA